VDPHTFVRHLLVAAKRRDELRRMSMHWPSWTVAGASLTNLEALVAGWLWPAQGYATSGPLALKATGGSVAVQNTAVTLDVSSAFAREAVRGVSVALRDSEGVVLAVLHVERGWEGDDVWHLGGRVEGIELPAHEEFSQLRLSPESIAQRVRSQGRSRALAFFAGDVLHAGTRAALTDIAQRFDSSIVVLIASGSAVEADFANITRVRAVQISASMLPADHTVTSVVPSAVWADGGPTLGRAAVMARNCGASVIAVDVTNREPLIRADVQFLESAIEVKFKSLQPWGYSPAAMRFVDPQTAEVPSSLEVPPSSREILSMLPAVPAWLLSPAEVDALQRAHPPRGAQGFTVLFSGLSGSGKSTIARALRVRLMELTGRQVTLLDGDLVRRHLSSELGFSREHRDLNVMRIGWVASEIVSHGGIAICAPIAPYDAVRKQVRQMIEPVGGFLLVHISTPIETCEARDRKGLYAKARAGLLANFTGISDPYEVPDDAALTIDTRHTPVDEACAMVLARLTSEGYLVHG
jgi:sulfate adenylyltransferase